jgi:histidinol dehydrogenase
MKIIRFPNPETFEEISKRPELERGQLEVTVVTILEMVKMNGDRALKDYSRQFDQVDLENLQVSEDEIKNAIKSLPTDLRDSIKIAQKNVEQFHASQFQPEQIIETTPGVKCWRKSTPIQKVGLYVPGGSAPLFSTLLMLGVPAKLAGCEEIVVCTPPVKDGSVDMSILYTADLLGIKKIFKTGGAQAIAAMAFGTESVPKVYKIFGPGNQYVTIAKQLAQMEGVAIDMPAGPSEVVIVADQTANPEFVAIDLLSQAEHGPDSQVILITTEEALITNVQDQIDLLIESLPRKDLAKRSLAHSQLILLENMDSAMDLVNTYAPEHLILMVSDPHALGSKIKNAGSVFIGSFTPESAGDYASGTNHTLPTNQFARMYSGVSLDSFQKNITFQEITSDGLQRLGPSIQKMATAEKLTAHSLAVELRLNQIKKKQ